MADIETVRLCLIGIIALVAILWHIPAKCDHPCLACDVERVKRQAKRLEEAHKAWHKGYPQPGCPFCEGRPQ